MPGEWKPKAADADRASKVRDELRNVLASEAFKGGKRAQDFLQLVVEHTLAGRLDSLRERMLGAEMFGRPVDYDTANDAVVRVKASEVRRRLAQYYGSLEAPPPVRIDLPPGSYVPQFSFDASPQAASGPLQWRRPVVAPAEVPPARRSLFGMSRLFVVLTGLALATVAVAIAIFIWKQPALARPDSLDRGPALGELFWRFQAGLLRRWHD